MKVIADLTVIPIGIGISVSNEIALCHEIFKKYKLDIRLHAYGTNIEGEWDDVFAAVKECHEVLHKNGIPRIHSNMKFGTRTDKEQTMQDKIDSVYNKIKK